MQSIYNYIPETNPVSRVSTVAAVLYLQFVLHVMLCRPWKTFCIIIIIIIIIRSEFVIVYCCVELERNI